MFFSTLLHFVRKCSILARTEVAMFFFTFFDILLSASLHLNATMKGHGHFDFEPKQRGSFTLDDRTSLKTSTASVSVYVCLCVYVCVEKSVFLLMCKGFGDVMHLIRYLKINFSAFPNSFTLYVCLSLSLHWFLPPSALSRSTPAFLLIADPLVQSRSVTL